jgi:hypothetical protein
MAADELGATTRERTKAAVTAAKVFFMGLILNVN